MSSLYIFIVILVSLVMCPSCFGKCDSFYVIMEKNINDITYKPIDKHTSRWSINNIHTHNGTQKFNMECVLDLSCQNISLISTKLRIGVIDEDGTHRSTNILNDTKHIDEVSEHSTASTSIESDVNTTEKAHFNVTLGTVEPSTENVTSSIKEGDNDTKITSKDTEERTAPTTIHREVTVTENTNLPVAGSTDVTVSSTPEEKPATTIRSEVKVTENNNLPEPGSTDVTLSGTPESYPEEEPATTIRSEVKVTENNNLPVTGSTGVTAGGTSYPEEIKTLTRRIAFATLGASAAVGVGIIIAIIAKKIGDRIKSGAYYLPNPAMPDPA